MEPVGWVSCGCGKGINIYARKQEAKATAEKVAKQLPAELEAQPKPKVERAAAQETVHERPCAWCGNLFKPQAKHLKCCKWNCYLKKKEQNDQMQAITALGSSSALPVELDEPKVAPTHRPGDEGKPIAEEAKEIFDKHQ